MFWKILILFMFTYSFRCVDQCLLFLHEDSSNGLGFFHSGGFPIFCTADLSSKKSGCLFVNVLISPFFFEGRFCWIFNSLLTYFLLSPFWICYTTAFWHLWFLMIQFSSVTQSCTTVCDPMNCSTPGLQVHHQLPEFTQTHVHRVGDAIQPSQPLASLSSLPLIPPGIRVFSSESTLRMRWPKYWSFSFSISPSKEHPGPISFRMDWLDLFAFKGTLKSLFQHHSSKASILRHSAFFIAK